MVHNAIKFNHPGGEVLLHVRPLHSPPASPPASSAAGALVSAAGAVSAATPSSAAAAAAAAAGEDGTQQRRWTVHFEVTDTGRGVSPDLQRLLFQPFFSQACALPPHFLSARNRTLRHAIQPKS